MKHVSLLLPPWKRKERSPETVSAALSPSRGGSFRFNNMRVDPDHHTGHRATPGSLGVKRTRSRGSSSESYLDMDEGRSQHSRTPSLRVLRSSKSVVCLSPSRPAPPPPLYPLSSLSASCEHIQPLRQLISIVVREQSPIPETTLAAPLGDPRGSSYFLTSPEAQRGSDTPELDGVWEGFLREMEEEDHFIDPACPSRSLAIDALSPLPPPRLFRSRSDAPLQRGSQLPSCNERLLLTQRSHTASSTPPRGMQSTPMAADMSGRSVPFTENELDDRDDRDSLIDPLLSFPRPPPLIIRKRLPPPISVPPTPSFSSTSSSSSSTPSPNDTPIGTPTTPKRPHPYANPLNRPANLAGTPASDGDVLDYYATSSTTSSMWAASPEKQGRAGASRDEPYMLHHWEYPSSSSMDLFQRADSRVDIGAAMLAIGTHRSYLSAMGRQAPSRRSRSRRENHNTTTSVSWGIAV
ncbi:hypothetical protein BD626DRAFT_108740 [Schizophyllum amplum]|uniref:Uncharacterized protein n=1 Tax=Schizophyllum amplum TaxID=97359 RepID=A0A550CT60_9AGAR|nr:hypothetical protein BD626DRAFT_108740 [Auriculariopsis ampla]